MKNINFWDITPCSPLSVNLCFGRTYRLHLQGRRNNFSKKPARKKVASRMLLYELTLVNRPLKFDREFVHLLHEPSDFLSYLFFITYSSPTMHVLSIETSKPTSKAFSETLKTLCPRIPWIERIHIYIHTYIHTYTVNNTWYLIPPSSDKKPPLLGSVDVASQYQRIMSLMYH
jgi:hypothetical protein